MKRSGLVASLLFAVFAVLLIAVAVLVSTDWGLKWTFAQVSQWMAGELKVTKIEGRLIGPIAITGLTYETNGTKMAVDRIGFDWSPWTLLDGTFKITQLAIKGVNIQTEEKKETPQAQAAATRLPTLKLPLPVVIDHAEIKDLSYISGRETPTVVQDLALKARATDKSVHIDYFNITTSELTAHLAGDVKPNKHYTTDVQLQWSVSQKWKGLTGKGTLKGNPEKFTLRQQLGGPVEAVLQGTVFDLLDKLHWQAELDIQQFDSQKIGENWGLEKVKGKIEARGDLNTVQSNGMLRGIYQPTGELQAEYRLTYQPDKLVVDNLTLSLPGKPAFINMNGKLLKSKGEQGEFDYFKAKGHWQSIAWPLTGEQSYQSPQGDIDIEGTLDAYRFHLQTQLAGKEIPEGQWDLSGQGGTKQISFSSIESRILSGSLTGQGQLTWAGEQTWNLNLKGEGLDPGVQWPKWKGHLAVAASTHGSVKEGHLNADVDISNVAGTLRNQSVQAQTRIAIDGDNYTLTRLAAKAGSATLSASGSLTKQWNLKWSLQAKDLGAFYPDSGGSLAMRGQLEGPRASPYIKLTAQGKSLFYQDYKIGQLQTRVNADYTLKQHSQIDLTIKEARIGERAINSLTLKGSGTEAKQSLMVTLESLQEKLDVNVEGGIKGQIWSGYLLKVDLQHKILGHWRLARPVAAKISKQEIQLQPWCLDSQQSNLCGDFFWDRTSGDINSHLKITNLTLAALQPLLLPGMKLTGMVNGEATIHYVDKKMSGSKIALRTTSGVATYSLESGKPLKVNFSDAKLNMSVDETGFKGSALLDVNDHRVFDANIELPNWDTGVAWRDQPITGDINFDIAELGFLPSFIKYVENTKGTLNGKLQLAGKLGDPKITGEVLLDNGYAEIPQAGIALKDISIAARSKNGNNIELEGKLTSGKGVLKISGQITPDPKKGWPTIIDFKGEGIEAANLPEAQVVVSPTLELLITGRRIDLVGEVKIPEAQLHPPEHEGAVTVSNDVVVVNTGQNQQKEEKWKIFTTVRVELGDKVKFTGFGVEGRITGQVVASDEPNTLTTGYGELQIVDGKFSTYNMELTIQKGRLTFAGGPINNPGIDVRAVRVIGDVTAGVQVRGTLKNLQLTLFSEPPKDQADVLSYLLFGVPISGVSTEQGRALFLAATSLRLSGGASLAQKIGNKFGIEEVRLETGNTPQEASLVLGKYLSPKLYINYSYGIFETSNTLRLRYQLSNKWILQSEAGSTQSGADLLYTFEH